MHTRQTYPDKLRQFNGYKDMKTSCQTQEVQTLRKGNPLKEEDIFFAKMTGERRVNERKLWHLLDQEL